MTSQLLPDGWMKPSFFRRSKLTAQVSAEIAPNHPLAGAGFQVVAVRDGTDDLIIEAPELTPRYYLVHLQWAGNALGESVGGDDLAALAASCEPDGDDVDEVTLWTDAETESGAVFVQHLLNGSEIVDVLQWPSGALSRPGSVDTAGLMQMGWIQVKRDLRPKA